MGLFHPQCDRSGPLDARPVPICHPSKSWSHRMTRVELQRVPGQAKIPNQTDRGSNPSSILTCAPGACCSSIPALLFASVNWGHFRTVGSIEENTWKTPDTQWSLKNVFFFFIRNERRGEILRTVEIHKSGIKYAPQMTSATILLAGRTLKRTRKQSTERTACSCVFRDVQLSCSAPGRQRVGSELPAHSRPLPTQSLLACEVNATENSHL